MIYFDSLREIYGEKYYPKIEEEDDEKNYVESSQQTNGFSETVELLSECNDPDLVFKYAGSIIRFQFFHKFLKKFCVLSKNRMVF